jgi:hypothetical protein
MALRDTWEPQENLMISHEVDHPIDLNAVL